MKKLYEVQYIKDWKVFDFLSIVELYNSVGWVAYTTKPDDLKKAFENSSYVEIAVIDSRVVGIIRTLSDSVSIHYIQDIIVHPEFQRYGVGRHLLKSVLAFYADVRTHILLTDNEERQKLFYESLGFKNSKELKKYELNSFLKMKEIELS